ncbi:MAG: hypothetical protein R3202_03145, partial [Candidatus Competibacterales bacterium]|nr:hypothetical protein [Candidatus Competibacterales bacterium]
DHALQESRRHRINALVFIGDCVEERPQHLQALAGQLGLLGIPLFVFHEHHPGDRSAADILRELAGLTRGAYCRHEEDSPDQLRELLQAVAVYATGGRRALEALDRNGHRAARLLTHQLG